MEAPIEPHALAQAIAQASYDKKAENIVLLDLQGKVSYCDGFVICSGTNRRHVSAIATGVVEALREQGVKPLGVEGMEASRWILIDFGDVICHVFDEPMRGFYDLESLWSDAKRPDFQPSNAPTAG